jgi:hypothetical protein
MSNQPVPDGKRKFSDDMDTAGSQMVASVKDAIQKGNMRRIIITGQDGTVYVDTTLTVGAALGAVMAIVWLPIVVLVAVAAVVARVKIAIVREVEDEEAEQAQLVDAVSRITIEEEPAAEAKPKPRAKRSRTTPQEE